MVITPDISFGTVITVVSVVIASITLRASIQARHDEGVAKMTAIETKVDAMFKWYQSHLDKSR